MNALDDSLRTMLGEAACGLFDAYGVPHAQTADPVEEDEQLCGILGFTGNEVCGSIVLVAAPRVIAASNPVIGGSASRWVAELTNQIVGRFKNDLFRRGVDVDISVPVVLAATHLAPVLRGAIAPIHIDVDGSSLSLWIEIEGDLTLHAPDDSATAHEGDTLLF